MEQFHASWTFTVAAGAEYEVELGWLTHGSRTQGAPVEIWDGTTRVGTVSVDQRRDGAFQQVWEDLGTFTISSGTLVVKLSDAGVADGIIVADAVRVTRV